ncbi:MAG: hypothetical protein ACXV3V_13245, partial [Actinomycetes bacterium]
GWQGWHSRPHRRPRRRGDGCGRPSRPGAALRPALGRLALVRLAPVRLGQQAPVLPWVPACSTSPATH